MSFFLASCCFFAFFVCGLMLVTGWGVNGLANALGWTVPNTRGVMQYALILFSSFGIVFVGIAMIPPQNVSEMPEEYSLFVTRGTIGPPELSYAIPYLNGKSFLDTLEKHKSEPATQVLAVTGPKSNGKSRGIKQKCYEWEKTGDLCIFINLKNWNGSVNEFGLLFAQTFINAINRTNFSVKPETVKQIKKYFHPTSALWSLLFKLMPAPINATMTHFDYDPVVIDLAIGLIELYRKKYVDSHDVVSQFNFLYEAIDKIAFDAAPNKIIVIISESQQLGKIGKYGKMIFDTIYKHFGLKKMAESQAVHIIETSDAFWVVDNEINENSASFQPYVIPPMDYKSTKDDVVSKYALMKETEFNQTWEFLGGYAGGWYQVLKAPSSTPLTSRFQALSGLFSQQLSDAITTPNKTCSDAEVMVALKALKDSGYKLKVAKHALTPAMKHLIRRNICFYDGEYLIPQNKIIQNKIEELDFSKV